jgi:hypothetical protein
VRRMTRWGVIGLLAATTTLGLTGCREHGLDSAPASTAPAAGTGDPAVTRSSATPAPAPVSSAAQVAQSAQSAALAQVSTDLSGINVGVSQAGTDLGAGDSARTQSDDGN